MGNLQNGISTTYPNAKSLIMLGTGTSGASLMICVELNSGGVPSIACLTNPKRQCAVCPSAMTREGVKNFRYFSMKDVEFILDEILVLQ